MLTGISNRNMFFGSGKPTRISQFHQPYVLAMGDRDIATVEDRIKKVGQYEQYQSWVSPNKKREVFRVYVDHPSSAPKVAEELFDMGLNIFEFDVKYILRVLCDLAVDKDIWLYDTQGKVETLKILVYDIEKQPNSDMIHIIGYYRFEIKIKSTKDLKTEKFNFEIKKIPDVQGMLKKYNKGLLKIPQLIAKSEREEVINLHKFVCMVMNSHVISGHNILNYDNREVVDRVRYYMLHKALVPSNQIYSDFEDFLNDYVYDHQGFNQIVRKKERTVCFYPSSFDTLPAAQKFMRYLEVPNYSLKKLVPKLGFRIKNRIYMSYKDIKHDFRSYKYNRDDVMEQICLSLMLLQQALPMALVSNYPFEHLATSGNIQLWDYMTMIRAYHQKVIMPPSVSPKYVAQDLLKVFPDKTKLDKKGIEEYCKGSEVKGDMRKIGRYGLEMPNWVTLPRLVLRHETVGGLPLKPQELGSQYVMWYGVVEADVAGMYPNIVISRNACSDKVRFAKPKEKPDDWVMFWNIDKASQKHLQVKETTTVIGRKAYKVGVKIYKKKGMLAHPMGGLLRMIGEVRKKRKESDTMQHMYDSLKALRNAGSISGGRRITIRYPDGSLRNVEIGKFIDSLFMWNSGDIRRVRLGSTVYKKMDISDKGYYVPSTDKFGRVSMQLVKQIIKYPYKGCICKISNKAGDSEITPNHGIYSAEGLELDTVSPFQVLKESMRTASCESLPNTEVGEQWVWTEKKKFRGGKLPRKILVDKKLAEFLGYYISEGWCSFNKSKSMWEVCISGQHTEFSIRIKKLFKDLFNLSAYSIPRERTPGAIPVYTISVTSTPLHHFLDHILKCGTKSREKRVPYQILSAPKKIKYAFLSAYLYGDGCYYNQKGGGYHTFNKTLKTKVSVRIKKGYNFSASTNSDGLRDDILVLCRQMGYKMAFRRDTREDKECWGITQYHTKMRQSFRIGDFTLSDTIVEISEPSKYVYDLSVANNENFMDASGMLLHNTHGIVLSPRYSNRQFNLASGTLITSMGQEIMSDIFMEYKKAGIRTIYGDTDSVYAACYKSAYEVEGLVDALSDDIDKIFKTKRKRLKKYRITSQKKVLAVVNACNKKWRKKLKYKDFAFEIEKTPGMIISAHKNYIKIVIDDKTGKVKIKLKGASFTAKDKPDIAENALKRIIIETVKANMKWVDEKESAFKVNSAIRKHTSSIVTKIRAEDVDIKDLALIQTVKEPKAYEDKNGLWYKRAVALQELVGEIGGSIRLDFLVVKKPLKGLEGKTSRFKPTVKPLAYMKPLDLVTDLDEIDYQWYNMMIIDYVSGAFGFNKKAMRQAIGDGSTSQMGIADFM